MSFEAHVIKDSISPAGIRLLSYQLRYPRFIHAELMTHRVFSRNASSSRAIPVERMIRDLRRDPARPVHWGSNKQGMQAGEELTGLELQLAQSAWEGGMEDAIKWVETMVKAGLHKQVANRMLEPWGHINVIVTSTEWENFFTLRRNKDAQPEIKVLADLMWDAREVSTPELLVPGQWHLPYVDQNGQSDDRDAAKDQITQSGVLRIIPTEDAILMLLTRVSVARCARVSYLTHDGRQTTVKEDLELHDRLMGRQPLHASPAEHQATPDRYTRAPFAGSAPKWDCSSLHGNLNGWIQYRQTLSGQYIPG